MHRSRAPVAAFLVVILAAAVAPARAQVRARPDLTGPIRGLDGAVEVPMEVAGGRLLIPATLHGPGGSRTVLVMFDTGTFVPVLLLSEAREAVGTRDGYLDSLTVDGATVQRPATGRHGSPGALRRVLRRAREAADRFTELPLAGVLGGSAFHRAIASLHVAGERLVLRPADSERRTLYDREPVAAADYRSEQHNIWIPATVDGTGGHAHLDTGYSRSWVAASAVSGRTPASFRVGGVDLLPHLSGAAPRAEERGERYDSVPLDVVANIGVDALTRLVVTVDAPRQRVYFERPGVGR